MNIKEKLPILADAAKYDASCASSGSRRARPADGLGNAEGMGICHSFTPDGRCVSLLKILFTNHCIYDCLYCVNRVSSDTPRALFTVDEVVNLTLDFYRRNYIEGLFLSSGIIRNADYTMEQLVEVARRLRVEHRFGGYIHLKAIPGCSPELLESAGRWADRLSANIELARQVDLDALAPAKRQVEIEDTMRTLSVKIAEAKDAQKPAKRSSAGGADGLADGLSELNAETVVEAQAQRNSGDRHSPRARAPRFAPAGQTTQMIVGATPATDESILGKATSLYREHGLRRVYYSAYSPTQSPSSLITSPQMPLVREHRLYEADWLLRYYEYTLEDLPFGESGNLSLDCDPKIAWALQHRAVFPVDVNRGDRHLLLKVPGLGVRTVDRILKLRRLKAVTLQDLRLLGVPARARYFVTASDPNPFVTYLESHSLESALLPPKQLHLFQAVGPKGSEPVGSRAALTGEL